MTEDVSCNTINRSNAQIPVIITNHQNITIMNKEQLDAIRLYCKLTFDTTDVSVTEAIDCIDEDAFDAGLTQLQYIEYLIVNGFKP